MNEINCGKCAGCPNVIHATDVANNVGEGAKQLGNAAMDSRIDHELAPEIFSTLQGVGELVDPDSGNIIGSPEELASAIRKDAAGFIAAMDLKVEVMQNRVQGIIDGCSGPLKMRATKDGRTITVTVCNSPEAPDGEGCEKVHLRREQA